MTFADRFDEWLVLAVFYILVVSAVAGFMVWWWRR